MYYHSKNCLITVNGKEFLVNNAGISLATDITPQYKIRNKYAQSYYPSQGLVGSLKMNYYLADKDPLKQFIIKENSAISGNFAGMYFESGYLKSYNLSYIPNNPVNISAEIAFFDDLKGVFSPSQQGIQSQKVWNFADAQFYSLTSGSGRNIGNITNPTKIDYSFLSNLSVHYKIDELLPYKIQFGKKEIFANIETDLISGNLPFSGLKGGVRMYFTHPEMPGLNDYYQVDGILHQKDIDVTAPGLIRSNIKIRQDRTVEPPIFIKYSTGTITQGGTFCIIGSGFTYTTDLYINNTLINNFSVLNDEVINVTFPSDGLSGYININTWGGNINIASPIVSYGNITIGDVSPITGKIGDNIRISGTGFNNISDVKFFGASSPKFNVLTSNLIEAEVPELATWGRVAVISSGQSNSGTYNVLFSPKPRIDGFSPATGWSGHSVFITGRCMSGVTGVYFNNILSLSGIIKVAHNSGVSGYIPDGNTSGYITLYAVSGLVTRSLYTFSPTMMITGLNPYIARTGIKIGISGNNFLSGLMYRVDDGYLVNFNGGTGKFVRQSDGCMTGFVPSGAQTGPVRIYATNKVTLYPSLSNFILIDDYPLFSYVIPTSGATGTGSILNIFGQRFATGARISLSGSSNVTGILSPVLNIEGTLLSFSVPPISGGRYHVIVSGMNGDVTGANAFYVLEKPSGSGFIPRSGIIGQNIYVSGLNLYPNTQIFINTTGEECLIRTGTYNQNYNSIEFYVPTTNLSGFQNLIIYNGINYWSGTGFFVIQKPIISGFIFSGSGEIGNSGFLTGRYFNYATGLYIGTNRITSFNITQDTGIVFNIPENSRTDFINIYSSGGVTTSTGRFVILDSPIIFSGFKPTGTRVGAQITFSGLRLNTVTGIIFSGSNNDEVSFGSDNFVVSGSTGIFMNVPNGIISGKIKLQNTRYVTGSDYIINIIPYPYINSITPLSGVYKQQINLSGENFQSDTDFYFLDTTGYYVKSLVTTIINTTGATVQVPREIKRGQIAVSGFDGLVSYSTDYFVPLPTITGFEPKSLATGAVLRITGINAYEVFNFLGASGTGELKDLFFFSNIIDSGKFTGNYFNLTGAHIVDNTTGFAIFSGTINDTFGYSGKLFLASIHDEKLSGDINNLISSVTYANLASGMSTGYIYVTQAAPVIQVLNSFAPISGNSGTLVTLTGNSLKYSTGVILHDIGGINSVLGTGVIRSRNNLNITFNPPSGFWPQIGNVATIGVRSYFGGTTSNREFLFMDELFISGFTPQQAKTGVWVEVTGSGVSGITGFYFGSILSQTQGGVHLNTYKISGRVPSTFDTVPKSVNLTLISPTNSQTIGLFNVLSEASLNKYRTRDADLVAIPGADGNIQFAHGFGKMPDIVKFYLVCQTAELNYSVGDEVELSETTGSTTPFTISKDTTNITLSHLFGTNPTISIKNKTTGATTAITNGNWKIRGFAYYFPD